MIAKNQEPRTKNAFRYPGGKNADGTFQRIINQIPPHVLYVEPFCGSAAICRYKRPALRTVLIDLDPGALDVLAEAVPRGTVLYAQCGIEWLEHVGHRLGAEAFIYADPPYLLSTRSKRRIYRWELTEAAHERLLAVLVQLRCPVMLSGYPSAMYARALKGWRVDTFEAMTRGGVKRTEKLWMNYPWPFVLHDYRYVGRDYRQRENLARQKQRWLARLRRMPALKREALLQAIAEFDRPPAETPVAAATGGNGGRISG